MSSFEVVAGDQRSPVLLHVPHSSRVIPQAARRSIVLDDAALAGELDAMTDAHTAVIADVAARRSSVRPWQFVNRTSRLVVDPERFPDEREEMTAVGMGAVYTRTSAGAVLREPDDDPDRWLLAEYFHPYAQALADEVDARLAAVGRAVILDVHSYPAQALPYERRPDDARPAVCLGVDPCHTPPALLDVAQAAFEPLGEVVVNEPFRGTYVPLRHYGVDRRVSSLMVEVRRDVYLAPDGSPVVERVQDVGRAIAHVVNRLSEEDVE